MTGATLMTALPTYTEEMNQAACRLAALEISITNIARHVAKQAILDAMPDAQIQDFGSVGENQFSVNVWVKSRRHPVDTGDPREFSNDFGQGEFYTHRGYAPGEYHEYTNMYCVKISPDAFMATREEDVDNVVYGPELTSAMDQVKARLQGREPLTEDAPIEAGA